MEPYCGSAAIFFRRHPSPVETLNDIDENVTNFFRVLRNSAQAGELKRLLELTPYSRSEWAYAKASMETESDPVQKAWCFFVGARMSFAGEMFRSFGFVLNSSAKNMASNISAYKSSLAEFERFSERLLCAQIENRCALSVIEIHDRPDAVIYCDPPYVASTRKDGSYRHETDAAHHQQLVELIVTCEGAIALSGYPNDIYKPLEDAGWDVASFETIANSAARTRMSGLMGRGGISSRCKRTEVLWRNPRCLEMLAENGRQENKQCALF